MSTPREDEQDTRALAERLRRSFDDDLSGHAIATPDGGILHCNAEFARIIGAPTVDDALTMNLHELEPVPGAFDQLLRRLQRTPLIPLERVRFVRRDGTRAQVMARLAASRDPGGQVSEVRVYLVDVSEQHRETRRLRARAERLRLAELATHDVTWDWDVPTARVRWNRAAVRRFRYTPDEVRPTIDWHVDRIHPEDRERVLRGMERTIFGIDNAWADEYRVLRGDGTYATVLDRAYVVRNGRCEPVRVVGSIVDITELKATEAAYRFLSAAGAELETALDVTSTAATLARISVPELAGFCLVDLLQEDGSLRRVAVAHERPGAEPMLAAGATIEAGAPLEAVESGHVQGATGNGTGHHACSTIGVDAEVVIGGYVTVPICGRDRTLGAVTFGYADNRRCIDPLHVLTVKELAKRAGLALSNAKLYEVAQSAVRSRNEVLGMVSHDLRLPLNTIVATLSLLSDSMPERRSDVRNWVEIIDRATWQIQHLIEDLLDVSRMESDEFTVEQHAASVVTMIRDACNTLEPVAAARQIRLRTVLPDSLPAVNVDAAKVVRVISNLVGNAIKFSDVGGTIEVCGERRGDWVLIAVRDHGPGIPPDQLTHVFDRFWQGRENDRRGAGLGLSIARGIFEAHGGRIWVRSRENEGSTFWFTLPIADAATSGEARAASVERRSSSRPSVAGASYE